MNQKDVLELKRRLKNGYIIGTTKMGTPNTFLATDKHYSDYILEFEFKVENDLNSGVKFRGQRRADYMNNRVHGYQFECLSFGYRIPCAVFFIVY